MVDGWEWLWNQSKDAKRRYLSYSEKKHSLTNGWPWTLTRAGNAVYIRVVPKPCRSLWSFCWVFRVSKFRMVSIRWEGNPGYCYTHGAGRDLKSTTKISVSVTSMPFVRPLSPDSELCQSPWCHGCLTSKWGIWVYVLLTTSLLNARASPRICNEHSLVRICNNSEALSE